jgi:hypothetical protein
LEFGIDDIESYDSSDSEKEEGDLRIERILYFVRKVLGVVVKNLLKRKVTNAEVRQSIDSFLQSTIRLIVTWIPLDEVYLFLVLKTIFDPEAKYYLVASTGKANPYYSVCLMYPILKKWKLH